MGVLETIYDGLSNNLVGGIDINFKNGDILEFCDMFGNINLFKYTGERYGENASVLWSIDVGSRCIVADSRIKEFKLVKPKAKFYLDI